jgi:hypothetical protein
VGDRTSSRYVSNTVALVEPSSTRDAPMPPSLLMLESSVMFLPQLRGAF